MSNILASLTNAGNALDVFQQALTVVQNNVNNSSTPGYATQTLNLVAQPLVVTGGLTGGVASQGLQDSRDDYVEEQVQQQTQTLGLYTCLLYTSEWAIAPKRRRTREWLKEMFSQRRRENRQTDLRDLFFSAFSAPLREKG